MKHRSTRDVIEDLRAGGRLIEITDTVDPHLEIAEIQRRVYARGGPALLFSNVRGCRFPMAGNLFASLDQARYLFRDTLDHVRRVIELKIDPTAFLKRPWRYPTAPLTALRMLPRSVRRGPVSAHKISLSELPQLVSWPDDGGAFITLPQVLSLPPSAPANRMQANLGMYRVQVSGNQYDPQHEVGMHYQIHRGIGVHHRAALDRGEALPVTVTVGGSPAMTLAAVMPLPEGLSELTFAGALAGRRISLIRGDHAPVYADADFAILGRIDPTRLKPEGPFGDHLGYYSLQHDFPVMQVDRVWHREGAVWPFTVVGRPPQEDTTFGQLIHELTGSVIPTVLPGVRAVHAVDAAGVHPLLLAIGSERYMPHLQVDRPQELLTQANAILGNGQLSLAKYLLISEDRSGRLDIHDIDAFLQHVLERFDPRRDLHFHTRTTIDTLDYSGGGLNQGSKLVIAAADRPLRRLATQLPADLRLPAGFHSPRLVRPGIMAVQGPPASDEAGSLAAFCRQARMGDSTGDSVGGATLSRSQDRPPEIAWVTLVDDSQFVVENLANWLWVTFTRSNPAVDVDGLGSQTVDKHWGCVGPLVIDARIKPHHAPPLVEDRETLARVDARATRNDALAPYL